MFKKSSLLLSAVALTALPALASNKSGINVGDTVSAFHPKHVAGPLKGTDGCPPCTYGSRPQVQVWVNGDDAKNVDAIAKNLAGKVKALKGAEFQSFIIYIGDAKPATEAAKSWAADALHVAYLAKDSDGVGLYKVNTDSEIKNTIFVYKNKKVTAKFVNFKADEKGLTALDKAISEIAH